MVEVNINFGINNVEIEFGAMKSISILILFYVDFVPYPSDEVAILDYLGFNRYQKWLSDLRNHKNG